MPQDVTITFPALNSWVRAAARCGFNIEPSLARFGIDADLTQLQSNTISLDTLDNLMQACVDAAAPELHFPFVLGECFTFDFMPELETYLSTSASLRDATGALGWIRDALNPYIDFRLQESDHVACLALAPSPAELPRSWLYHAESCFAAVLRFMRLLLPAGDVQRATRLLRFRHAPPVYAADYEAFFGLPVAFNQSQDALEFDRELLDQPLGGDFPSLHRQAAWLVQQKLSRMPHHQGAAARVHALLMSRPALRSRGIEQVATALALHPRNLQRRLHAQGTSFAALQDEASFRSAVALMREGQALEAIGETLGFSDRRSFTRAFKRWSGMTPSEFRRTLPS